MVIDKAVEESATNAKGLAKVEPMAEEMKIVLDCKAVITEPATPQVLEVRDADIDDRQKMFASIKSPKS